MQVFHFLNNLKDLDLSYKTDLDFVGLSWKEKTLSYSKRNMVILVILFPDFMLNLIIMLYSAMKLSAISISRL